MSILFFYWYFFLAMDLHFTQTDCAHYPQLKKNTQWDFQDILCYHTQSIWAATSLSNFPLWFRNVMYVIYYKSPVMSSVMQYNTLLFSRFIIHWLFTAIHSIQQNLQVNMFAPENRLARRIPKRHLGTWKGREIRS